MSDSKSPRPEAPAPIFVPAARTTLKRSVLLATYARTFAETSGQWPSNDVLAILWAMWAHETGRGKDFWWFNVGNMRGVSPENMYTVLDRAWEIIDGKRVITGGRFRAYTNLYNGCTDYMEKLSVVFTPAWDALLAPSPSAESFVRGLEAKGYFTGKLDEYIRSVVSLTHECLVSATLLQEWPEPSPFKYAREPGLELDHEALVIASISPTHTPAGVVRESDDDDHELHGPNTERITPVDSPLKKPVG